MIKQGSTPRERGSNPAFVRYKRFCRLGSDGFPGGGGGQGVNDSVDGKRAPLEPADDRSLLHHQDPVRHAQQLFKVRGDQNDGLPLQHELVDDVIDLDLAALVDIAAGLVDHQDLAAREDPLAQQHLLLVAARQVLHLFVVLRGLDDQLFAERAADLLLQPQIQMVWPLDTADIRHGDVLRDGKIFAQKLVGAGVGNIADAVAHGVVRAAQGELCLIERDASGQERIDAEQRPRQRAAPGAEEAGDAEHLALAQLKRRAAQTMCRGQPLACSTTRPAG